MPDGATLRRNAAIWPPNRLAAGVVLYHPAPEACHRVEKLAAQFDCVFVVENESSAFGSAAPVVQVVHNQTNRGLAGANNQLADAARAAGFDWLVLFDQDSRVPGTFRGQLETCFEAIQSPPALLAANYRTELLGDVVVGYQPPGTGAVGAWVAGLNSGSMLDLATHHALGGHDEQFFVDHVDHEYCLRLRRHGYRVLATRAPLFRHEVGHVVCARRFGRVWQSSGHPAWRRREWARNLVRLSKRYWRSDPVWCSRQLFGELPRSLIAMLILERGRGAKLAELMSGLMDGVFARRQSKFVDITPP